MTNREVNSSNELSYVKIRLELTHMMHRQKLLFLSSEQNLAPSLSVNSPSCQSMIYNRLLLSIALILAQCFHAWDAEGHRVIARVAGRLLTGKAARYIRDHLPKRPGSSMVASESALVEASPWADSARDEFPWSKDLHFSFTPYRACEAYDAARDCGVGGSGRCIVSAIGNYTARAVDLDLPYEERTMAIKFLAHFIADGHQGLHIGFREDYGGNAIGLAEPEGVNLHDLWDSHILASQKGVASGDNSWYGIAGELASRLKEDMELRTSYLMSALGSIETAEAFAAAIVSETALEVTCPLVYMADGEWIEDGFRVSESYMAQSREVMLNQFMKAGVRLAQLLDHIASAYYSAEHERVAIEQGLMKSSKYASPISRIELMSENRFAPIFCPEDVVYYVEDEEFSAEDALDSEDFAGADEDSQSLSAVSVVANRGAGAPSETTTTISPDEAKRARRAALNRKKRLRKKIAKRKIFGIDVESIVLIKRGVKFYITYKHLVTSEEYTPVRFMINVVEFENKAAPIPFLLDMDVFTDEREPPHELLVAIFRKLRGMDYGEELIGGASAAAATDEDPAFTSSVKGSSAGRETALDIMRERLGPVEEIDFVSCGMMPRMGGIVSYETITDILPPLPTKAYLREHFGTSNPGADVITDLTFDRNKGGLIALNTAHIMIVSTASLLSDLRNRRWVFNKFSIIDSKRSLTDSSLLFIDVRLFDGSTTAHILEEIATIPKSFDNRKLTREVLARNPPIVKAMMRLSRLLTKGYFDDPMQMAEFSAMLESVSVVSRPAKPVGFETLEYVLRSPEEYNRVKTMMVAMAPSLCNTGKLLGVGLPTVKELDDR